jgi:FkbM family methyltransferase
MIKRLLFRFFVAIFPKKYLPLFIQRLSEASYQRCEFPGYDIYLNQGIAVAVTWGSPEEWIEQGLVDWIDTYFKPGQVFYDVGANVGIYSLIAAKRHRGSVKVYAFEPATATVAILNRNILRNDCADVIVPMSFPLSRRPTLAPFNYYATMIPGRGLHAFGDAVDFRGKQFKPAFQEFMVSSSIDQLVKEYGLPAPHHIKIDVDGLEAEILAGAESVLRSGVVESLFFEVGGRFDEAEMSKFLVDCGFAPAASLKHENTCNLIFVKQKQTVPA